MPLLSFTFLLRDHSPPQVLSRELPAQTSLNIQLRSQYRVIPDSEIASL